MDKTKVVAFKNLPFRSPVHITIVWYLFLSEIEAPGWVWGSVGFVFFLVYVLWIFSFFNEDRLDPFTAQGDRKE